MDINDTVKLDVDLPEDNLKQGAIGVIVEIFSKPNTAYEVEFCNDKGETIVTKALKEHQIKLFSN